MTLIELTPKGADRMHWELTPEEIAWFRTVEVGQSLYILDRWKGSKATPASKPNTESGWLKVVGTEAGCSQSGIAFRVTMENGRVDTIDAAWFVPFATAAEIEKHCPREVIAKCEGCGKEIREGEPRGTWADGVTTCGKYSPPIAANCPEIPDGSLAFAPAIAEEIEIEVSAQDVATAIVESGTEDVVLKCPTCGTEACSLDDVGDACICGDKFVEVAEQRVDFWAVTVSMNGETLLTIDNDLSGKANLTETEMNVIRQAGEHLLGFAGSGEPAPFFDPETGVSQPAEAREACWRVWYEGAAGLSCVEVMARSEPHAKSEVERLMMLPPGTAKTARQAVIEVSGNDSLIREYESGWNAAIALSTDVCRRRAIPEDKNQSIKNEALKCGWQIEHEATSALGLILRDELTDLRAENSQLKVNIGAGDTAIRQLENEVDSLTTNNAALAATVAGMREALEAVESLIAESRGVAGLHANGDVAEWDSLRTGGRFEEWLLKLDTALAAGKGESDE